MKTLEQALNEHVIRSLTVVRTSDGYQASLHLESNAFRVEVRSCPSAAVRAVLGMRLGAPPVKAAST